MKHITQPQQKKVHALARELGMDDDLLHEYVYLLTERTSLRELSLNDAVRVIDGLEGKRGYAKGDRITYRQESYIFILAEHLGWTDETGRADKKRINGFIKKQYGVEDYRWLTKELAGKLIEALKDMEERKKREARRKES